MSTTAENNFFNFDLSLLPDTSNNITLESRVEKQRKSIFILKKKVVSTDAAVENVLNSKALLDESKKKLSAATEENKQICIDYNSALVKIKKLEKDGEISHKHLKELQEKLEISENQYKAIQSHANQLQQLVLDCETQIESLRIENQLIKANSKEQTKNTQSKEIDYDTLINDLCLLRDVILGKKKLQRHHKVILKKYNKYKSNADDSASECSVGDIEDVFNDTTASFLSPHLLPKAGIQRVHQSLAVSELVKNIHSDDLSIKTICGDHDSDSNNEVVSEDTGRGSSLACSDIEKCYNSPDYFITNSPLSIAITNKKNYTDVSTSPITIQIERSDACTSPVLFCNKINAYNVEEIKKQTRDIGVTVDLNDLMAHKYVAKKQTKDIGTTVDINDLIAHKHVATKQTRDIGITVHLNDLIAHKHVATKQTKDIGITVDTIDYKHVATKQTKDIGITVDTIDYKHVATKQTKDIGITVDTNDLIAHKHVATKQTKDIGITVDTIDYKHVATKQTKDIGITVDTNDLIAHKHVATNTIKINIQERASSPLRVIECYRGIRPLEKNYLKRVASPVEKNLQEQTTNPIKHIQQEKTPTPIEFKEIYPKTQTRINEKESVEINNSEVVDDDQGSDCEVENILRSVRLDYKLITPIPKSPAKVQKMYHNLEYLGVDNNALREHVNANFVHDDKETTRSNDKDFIMNIHEKVLPEENCETVESPLKKSPTKLNIVYSIKPPNLKEASEIVNVVNKNQIHNNKLEDKISHDSTVKIPIQIIDKIKPKKLTRLEKLRMKLLPKCKIPRDLTPPNRKISRLNPPLIQKSIQEQSGEPDKNNKKAYENAVKVFAEFKANEKNKPKSSAPCIAAINNKSVTKELQIFIPKCDGLMAQNKNLISSPPSMVKSIVKSTTVIDNDSNLQSNTTKTENNTQTNIENSPSQRLRRSKRLSTSASTNFDISNKTITEEESTIDEVKCYKRLKRVASDKIQSEPTKLLRISDSSHTSDKLNTEESVNDTISKPIEYRRRSARLSTQNESQNNNDLTSLNTADIVNYEVPDIFNEPAPKDNECQESTSEKVFDPKDSILCRMLEKYGKIDIRYMPKALNGHLLKSTCKKLEDGIARLISAPTDNLKETMNRFLKDLSNCEMKYFLAALMKYLKNPARKDEMFKKMSILNSPPMTKSERVLLYILKQLQFAWFSTDFVEVVLSQIEFVLFQLNHTPEFGTIESMSHFYAVLCRYFGKVTRLRSFIIDAMYCVQFKSIAVIKQCVEVWMHILPLAHMGIAKSPIVASLVYLLHFYKCEDKFNRVLEVRQLLGRKYFYQVSEWTETAILEMLQNAISELSDVLIEKKMLRLCLIIMAKRRGPQWCQKHIVNKILMPLIKKDDVPEEIKEFCISMLGPLLKPYPNNMKADTEIVFDKLLKMLDDDVSPSKKEAIFSSLLCLTRHNQVRVNEALLAWSPSSVSAGFEKLMANYVREKTAAQWKYQLAKIGGNM